MNGKTCIVTGASRGIGFHTARALALKGASVVLVGHNQERGQDAVDRLRRALAAKDPQTGGSASFSLVDLSNQEEIRRFATSFAASHGRLDVLINNAGGFFATRRESAEGIEMTLALNHLNYFLLTSLLLGVLTETSGRGAGEASRIVNVSSRAHRFGRIRFNDLQLEDGYTGQRAYAQSKLANLLFTYELDRRLDDERVAVNALHPGFVNTNLGKDHWLVGPVLTLIHALFAKSPAEGAETPIFLASSPEVEAVSGKYFIDEDPVRSSPASYDEEAARRLWEISEEITGI